MRKTAKTFLVLLLVAAFVFATACTATEPASNPDPEPVKTESTTVPTETETTSVAEAGKEYTIRVACDKEAHRAENILFACDRLTEQLAAEGIKDVIKGEYILVDSDFENTMAVFAKSGDLPELMVGNAGKVNNCAKAGFLLESDEVINGSVYTAEVSETLREMGRMEDGKLYGVIQDTETRPVWFFKPALEQLGYDDAAMEQLAKDCGSGKFTMKDLQDLAKRAVDEGITKYGILHRPSNGA